MGPIYIYIYIYIYPLRDYIGPSFPHSLLRTSQLYEDVQSQSSKPRGYRNSSLSFVVRFCPLWVRGSLIQGGGGLYYTNYRSGTLNLS